MSGVSFLVFLLLITSKCLAHSAFSVERRASCGVGPIPGDASLLSRLLQLREDVLQDFDHVGPVLFGQIDQHVQPITLL